MGSDRAFAGGLEEMRWGPGPRPSQELWGWRGGMAGSHREAQQAGLVTAVKEGRLDE